MFKYQNWRRFEIPKYFRWPVSPSRKLRRVPSPWVSSSTVAAALISRLEMWSRFISPWNTRYIQVPDTGQLCSAPFNHGSLPTSRYFKIFQEKCGPSNSGSNCRSKSNRLVLPNLRLAIQHQDIREAVDYGVIKMNIDTDTQCPTRSVLLGSWAKMRMSRIQLHKWEILPWQDLFPMTSMVLAAIPARRFRANDSKTLTLRFRWYLSQQIPKKVSRSPTAESEPQLRMMINNNPMILG